MVVQFIGQTELGIEHVWTQLAFRRFQLNGSLTPADYDLVTAKLASWHYTTIIWNAHTLLAAGEESKWDVEVWPLKHCLELIRKSGPQKEVNAGIVLEFFKLLRSSSCIELKQSAVIQSALDALGDLRSARWILERLNLFFMVDVPSAEFVRLEIQFWLMREFS